jgi:hypothetical protein
MYSAYLTFEYYLVALYYHLLFAHQSPDEKLDRVTTLTKRCGIILKYGWISREWQC